MIVKVCGLTQRTSLPEIGRLCINYGGLIFVKSSPRFCGSEPFALPAGVRAAGVFRDQPLREVLDTAGAWGLSLVQLHGREDAAYASAVREAGYLVMKAVGIATVRDLRECGTYEGAVDYVLFDTPGGGTGRKFDWTWLETYRGGTDFLLAGGIGPDDAVAVQRLRHPRFAGVDLNSRFEVAPGQKDPALLLKFLSRCSMT